MIEFEIQGKPISWKAHSGYGRKSFNPLYKEREYVQWQIKSQLPKDFKVITGPVTLIMCYLFEVPKSFGKKKRAQAMEGLLNHTIVQDCTNCLKFYEDCLKKLVIEDDKQVTHINVMKHYHEQSKILIQIF